MGTLTLSLGHKRASRFISAADTGAGVKAVFYSLDGSTFFTYAGTLTFDPLQRTSRKSIAHVHAAVTEYVYASLINGEVILNSV